MPRNLVDLHCHLDLYPDHPAAVSECEEEGVYTLAVTTTPKAWPRNHELASRTKYVRAALGLHPQLVAERASELGIWDEYLPQTRYVGEVGLDAGPRFYRSFELQRRVFEHVLKACARQGDKVLTVHSVRAAKTVLDMVEAHLPTGRGRVVLHWFTGTRAEARRAVEMGCYFSINAEMMQGDRRRTVVASLPMERILTETDGPFTRIADRAARPTDVAAVVEAIARARGMSSDDVAGLVWTNLRRILSDEA